MPQLDIYAFTSVISWLIIFFFVIYNILLVSGLSRIYKILLYRKKKLEYYVSLRESLEKEFYATTKVYKKFIATVNRLAKSVFQISNNVIEKSLEVSKEINTKEISFFKIWLKNNYIGISVLLKNNLSLRLKKNILQE